MKKQAAIFLAAALAACSNAGNGSVPSDLETAGDQPGAAGVVGNSAAGSSAPDLGAGNAAGISGAAGSGFETGGAGGTVSTTSDGGAADGAADAAEPDTCVKGTVQPSQVVMLGDSYMDIGNLGPTLQKVANAKYRTYYLAGASMCYAENSQGNIPYQFSDMALKDNPDIEVIITDGGGNDILLNNRQCLSTPLMGDTQCHMVVANTVARAKTMLDDVMKAGVDRVVYIFYPRIDPNHIFTGPNSNDWLDYAYPFAAEACCGADTPPASSADLTCLGHRASGFECLFIDMRPEFVGHNMPGPDYWLQDSIHPNQLGADAIAAKTWKKMQEHCIAQ